jgi:hypothetical protein
LYRATVSWPSLAIPASGIICATMIKWNLGLLGRKWESSWVDCYVDMRSVWLLVNRMRGGVIPLRGLSKVSIRLASSQECESELEWKLQLLQEQSQYQKLESILIIRPYCYQEKLGFTIVLSCCRDSNLNLVTISLSHLA